MLMWTKLLITVLDLLFNLNICPHTSTVINFWTRLVVSSWAAGVTTKPCPHRPCPKLSTLYMQRPLTIFFCYYFCRWRIDRLHHPIGTWTLLIFFLFSYFFGDFIAHLQKKQKNIVSSIFCCSQNQLKKSLFC